MNTNTVIILLSFFIISIYTTGVYEVPVQPGVRNTINFDVSTLGQGATGMNSLLTGASTTNSGYTYSFDNLPNWINSINGATISGIPPVAMS